MRLLQKLYDNEINFLISTFWDAGFTWGLGDPANGFLAEGNADTFNIAVEELRQAVIEHYPGVL